MRRRLSVGLMVKLLGATGGAAVLFAFGGCLTSPRALRGMLPKVLTATAVDFVTDNDAVFDVFQDDFGTGTTFDDRSSPDANRSEPGDGTPAR